MSQLAERFLVYNATDVVLSEVTSTGVAPVFAAPLGSLALFNNGTVGRLYLKYDTADTDWRELTNIYLADGVLTGDRNVDGDNHEFSMTALEGFALVGNSAAASYFTVQSVEGVTLNALANVLFQSTSNSISIDSGTDTVSMSATVGVNISAPVTSVSNEVTLTAYDNTRDDTGTSTPINFLYTDATGDLLSAPITVASGMYLGRETVAAAAPSLTVTLPAAQGSADYPILVTLEKDSADPHLTWSIENITVNGFDVVFSSTTGTADYLVHWLAQIV